MNRQLYLDALVKERERHFDLPGMEHDISKSPNDWIATICSIIGEALERSNVPPTRHDFERSMIKASAVCLAALEHVEIMVEKKTLI